MTENDARRSLDAMLAPLGRALGLGPLATDEDGTCRLVLDDGLDLVLLPDPSREIVLVWCTPGALPRAGREEVLAALLCANLFWQGTSGATLALMPDSDLVILAAQTPLDADPSAAGLLQALEQVVSGAAAVRGHLSGDPDLGVIDVGYAQGLIRG
jgi:hypothetical protein